MAKTGWVPPDWTKTLDKRIAHKTKIVAEAKFSDYELAGEIRAAEDSLRHMVNQVGISRTNEWLSVLRAEQRKREDHG